MIYCNLLALPYLQGGQALAAQAIHCETCIHNTTTRLHYTITFSTNYITVYIKIFYSMPYRMDGSAYQQKLIMTTDLSHQEKAHCN